MADDEPTPTPEPENAQPIKRKAVHITNPLIIRMLNEEIALTGEKLPIHAATRLLFHALREEQKSRQQAKLAIVGAMKTERR